MRRILLLLTLCTLGTLASATTYYIAASGSDANNGTSKSTPWLHAPGMPNCASVCAGVTPAVGDSYIFRGGDTWHRSASTSGASDVPVGGQWSWSWSGTSGSCNYRSGSTSSCIYIGVDVTWYNSTVCGTSFCRPKLSLDNPTWANSTHQDSAHQGFITACTYEDHGLNGAVLSGNYVIVDWLEVWGKCWTVHSGSDFGTTSEFKISGNHDWFNHGYIHGWTEAHATSPSDFDQTSMLGDYSGTFTANGNGVDYSIFDGSDTGPFSGLTAGCTASGHCTGGPVSYNGTQYVMHSVCRNIANCFNPGAPTIVSDNLFDSVFESWDSSDHGGIVEATGAISAPQYVFNNVWRNSDMGITYNPNLNGALYDFNNVRFNIGNGGNCVALANAVSGTNPVYYVNDTTDNTNVYDATTCAMRLSQGGAPAPYQGTITFQNDHFVAYSALSGFVGTASGVTVSDSGNEVYQTESAANGQGYSTSNNYSPTSGSGATIGAGGNRTTFCSGLADTLAAAACAQSIAGISYNASAFTVTANSSNARPGSGAWDVGAYQFSSNYTITISAVGNGSVTSSPSGISCPVTCSYSSFSGSVVLTETPASGYYFSGWSGGACSGTSNTCTVTSAATVTATFALISNTQGTGGGTGQFIFGGVVTNGPSFPPILGSDNFYATSASAPQNGINQADQVALGPQRVYNTALANTPTPGGNYSVTAASCADVNNILAGTGGRTQIACGQVLRVQPGFYSSCNITDNAPACDANHYIQIRSAAVDANLPPEGTEITPCQKAQPAHYGYPYWSFGQPCSTNYVASFGSANTVAPWVLAANTAYRRYGPGLEFTRTGGTPGWAYSIAATSATPNGFLRTCNATNCTVQIGVGTYSLCCSDSGVTITSGGGGAGGGTIQSAVGGNLTSFSGNTPIASIVDDHDLTITQTYAQAQIGNAGAITSISRDASCNVTGAYSFTGTLVPAPSVGLHVFPYGVTDTSFNTATAYPLTSYSSTSTTTFSFGYVQTGCSGASSGSSSGGGLIDMDPPTLTTCPTGVLGCNGVIANVQTMTSLVTQGAGSNHIIYDRDLFTGLPYTETDNCLQLGDTDHIAVIDSFCWEMHAPRIVGTTDEGHGFSGGVNANTDANAGAYKFVHNFISASGENLIFGGGPQGYKLTKVTVTSGVLVTGVCTTTCGIPTGTTTQFMAGSIVFPGGASTNGINGPQTVTCCTTTTNANDTFTFPVTATCTTTCTDSSTGMAIGGYTPSDWEVRRNFLYRPPSWSPNDPSYLGGGPLPSGWLGYCAKNGNECKNCVNYLFEGNVTYRAWNTVDQLGAFTILTPKNQSANAPGAQDFNVIMRYFRVSDVNVALGTSNALADSGAAAYQGRNYSIHDGLWAEVGDPTLTCGQGYGQAAVACNATQPIQTADFRTGSPGAISSTPNYILANVYLNHLGIMGEVNMSNTMTVGGNNTNPSGIFGFVLKNSYFPNGSNNIQNNGGGTTSCYNGQTTPAARINNCLGNPTFDYNLIWDNSANTLSWPGLHTHTYAASTSLNFANYNNALPTQLINWGSQFQLLSSSPGHNAADDGTDIGPNVALVSRYTQDVDNLSSYIDAAPNFGIDYNSTSSLPTPSHGIARFWDTTGLQWPFIETANNVFTWTLLDSTLAAMYTNGVTSAQMDFARTPNFASSNPTLTSCAYYNAGTPTGGGAPGQCAPPSDLNADGTGTDLYFRNWVAAFVSHVTSSGYLTNHAHVAVYEVWNEPLQATFWTGTNAQLARMLQDMRCIIKGGNYYVLRTGETCPQVWATVTSVSVTGPLDTTAVVLMGSYFVDTTTNTTATQNALYCNNAPPANCDPEWNYSDMINVHMKPGNYSLSMEAKMDAFMANLAGILNNADKWKGVYNTEGGYPTTPWNALDHDMQAAFVGRFYLYSWYKGVQESIWYFWTAANGLGSSQANTAYTQVYSWMTGATGLTCSVSGTIYSCPYTLPNGVAAEAIWDNSQTCSGGTCTTTTQTVPSNFLSYLTLSGGSSTAIVSNQVPVGIKPILLQAQF